MSRITRNTVGVLLAGAATAGLAPTIHSRWAAHDNDNAVGYALILAGIVLAIVQVVIIRAGKVQEQRDALVWMISAWIALNLFVVFMFYESYGSERRVIALIAVFANVMFALATRKTRKDLKKSESAHAVGKGSLSTPPTVETKDVSSRKYH